MDANDAVSMATVSLAAAVQTTVGSPVSGARVLTKKRREIVHAELSLTRNS